MRWDETDGIHWSDLVAQTRDVIKLHQSDSGYIRGALLVVDGGSQDKVASFIGSGGGIEPAVLVSVAVVRVCQDMVSMGLSKKQVVEHMLQSLTEILDHAVKDTEDSEDDHE